MRPISIASIVSLLLALGCDTASNVEPVFQNYFIKYYGEDGNQTGEDLLINSDGSMVLLGNTSSQTSSLTTPFLVKIDPAGNLLWKRQLGELNERAVDVELDNQGNLIVVSNVGDEAESQIRLLRIDQSGRGKDSILINNGEKQIARSVTQVSDNSFLIAGYAEADPVANPQTMPIPPEDEADIIVVQVDTQMLGFKILLRQGGEHVGSSVKIFETVLGGDTKYLVFGDSDRPPTQTGEYKRAFEVISINKDGIQGLQANSGDDSELQTLAGVVLTPPSLQEGYLMVGTTFPPSNSSASNVYITQYTKELDARRIDKTIEIPGKRLAGISAAASQESFYILANEIRENNNRDIALIKLAGDGSTIGATSFGTLEGDDTAGAVYVLPDGRIAVYGTMQLETQKKMVLIVLSQNGKFSD